MSQNVINATFGFAKTARTARRYQWDKGQTLKINGVSLPSAYRVDFSTDPTGGTCESRIGDENGVQIPNKMFEAGSNIFAWIVLSENGSDERTVYVVEIPVKPRPQPQTIEPTPEEQTAIQQAIAALNSASRLSISDDGYLRIEGGE